MKKVNKKSVRPALGLGVLIAATVMLVSCEENGENERPGIVSFELGMDGDKTAVIGDELHMEAEVVAEGTIDRIEVEIHPEGDHDHKKGLLSVEDEEEWEFDTVYTKFSGLKNTEFHEHIEVPASAGVGEYHFYFKVIDMEGYQTVHEDEFELMEDQK